MRIYFLLAPLGINLAISGTFLTRGMRHYTYICVTKSNRNENWNCQHVYMRSVQKSQNFQFIPLCQAIFFFRWLLLACVVPMLRLQPRPVWNVFVFTFIPVWIHAALKSVGSVQQAEWLETSWLHGEFSARAEILKPGLKRWSYIPLLRRI